MLGSEACSSRAMALGTMKIADAMIVPTLIIVEPSSPSCRCSWGIRARAGRNTRPSAPHTAPTSRIEPVVLAEHLAQPVVRQSVDREVVGAGHAVGGVHRVDDSLFRSPVRWPRTGA